MHDVQSRIQLASSVVSCWSSSHEARVDAGLGSGSEDFFHSMSEDAKRKGWRFRGLSSFLSSRAAVNTDPAATAMSSSASFSALKVVESFPLTSRVTLLLARGSVLDFVPRHRNAPSAIVNAANTGCLGGGGVDGAITDAGAYMHLLA